MRIGLVDIDGHHFPNLALMKLSAWHKSQGDSVEFANPMFGCYDRVYMSKVFTFTPDCSDISLRGDSGRYGIPGLYNDTTRGGRAYLP